MKLEDRKNWRENQPHDQGKENCPLCNESEEFTIWIGKYWRICHNKYPILGLKNHLMAVPLRHVLLSGNLTKQEYGELKEVELFMEKFYLGGDYFSFVRQSVLSRSLEHLHYHYLPGRIRYKEIEAMLKKQGF